MGSPELVIRRLKVEGNLGCDLTFEPGLNAICAEQGDDPRASNTCGKTTLIELIRCGLGRRYGSYADFAELGSLKGKVDRLWLEVQLNREVLLIERSLTSVTGLATMRSVPYEQGIENSPGEDVSPSELSRIFLDRLGIPEVSVKKADGTLDVLTFPNLQRAFILHQEDSFFDILDKVQPDRRRTQIIGFLSGILSMRAFDLESEVGGIQQKINEITSRTREVSAFLSDHGIASMHQAEQFVQTGRRKLEEAKEDQRSLQQEILDAQQQREKQAKGRIETLRQELLRIQEEEQKNEQELMGLHDQRENLTALLGSFTVDRKKLRRLRASSHVLGTIEFGTCPRCLQRLSQEMKQREDHGRCSLCARPISRTSDDMPRAIPNEEALVSQTQETELLLKRVQEEIEECQRNREEVKKIRHELATTLDAETRVFVCPAIDRLAAQADVISRLNANVSRADALKTQAAAIDALRMQLGPLQEQFERLNGRLETARAAPFQKLEAFRKEFELVLSAIDWPHFASCSIDHTSLMPRINELPHRSYGTGMKGVAVLCYHLALLALASSTDTYMPKILVIDSPAHGDLNERTHDAVLKYIASLGSRHSGAVSQFETEEKSWQIILTTRRIVPELEQFRIATLSNPDKMLLRPSMVSG